MGSTAVLRVGDVLAARYRLHERVGGGGMGDVWKGEDTLLGRTVAVKVMLAKLAAEDNFRERFRREACAIAALDGPTIVDVYDYGEVSSPRGILAFLVMPYVDAKPLTSWLARSGRLSTSQTMRIIAQVADGLEIAHTQGVIHRDIKPGNILVREDGRVTLVDFGIARASGDLTMTTTGVVLGTVTYMSPEQASGEKLAPASDIYSLGVVAYQCLAGQPPFKADTPLGVLSAHLRNIPPRLPDGVPPAVAHIISRCLAKDAVDRWQSAGEFAAACRNLASAPDIPQVPSQVTRSKPVPPRVREPHFPAPTGSERRPTATRARPPVVDETVEEGGTTTPARRGLVLIVTVGLAAALAVTAAATRPWEIRQLVEITDESPSEPGSGKANEISAGSGDNPDYDAEIPGPDSPAVTNSATRSSSATPTDGDESPSPSDTQSDSPPEQEPVPDVLRQPESQARRSLKAAGFRPSVSYEGDGDIGCEVVSQYPEAGQLADPGSTVTITVNRAEICAGG